MSLPRFEQDAIKSSEKKKKDENSGARFSRGNNVLRRSVWLGPRVSARQRKLFNPPFVSINESDSGISFLLFHQTRFAPPTGLLPPQAIPTQEPNSHCNNHFLELDWIGSERSAAAVCIQSTRCAMWSWSCSECVIARIERFLSHSALNRWLHFDVTKNVA